MMVSCVRACVRACLPSRAPDSTHLISCQAWENGKQADCGVSNAFVEGNASPSTPCQGIFPDAIEIGKDLIAVISSTGLLAAITTDQLAQFFPANG